MQIIHPSKNQGQRQNNGGGVAQCSIDEASSRIHSTGVDPTGLGRWAWTRFQGKEGYGLRVLFAYRCNAKTEHPGSVYNQQKAYFDSIGDSRNPRAAFWDDLIAEITPWTEGTDSIVLGMDMNDDVRDAENVKHLKALNLTEVITHKHGHDGPNTHEFGSTPIDGLFVSPGLLEAQCGYLPFVFDHRLLWIDLDLETTFGYEPDISPRYKPRRLQYDDRRSRDRYLNKLSDLLCRESDFAERLETFVNSTQQDVPLTKPQLRYYDDLLKEHQAAANQAEHHCRHLFTGRQAWTPEFSRNRNHRLFWLKMLAKRHGKRVNSKFLQRLAKKAGVFQPLSSITMEQAIIGLNNANTLCKYYAKNHIEKRENFLKAWAAAEAAALRLQEETVLRNRILSEQTRINNRLIARARGKLTNSGVPKVLVETNEGIRECVTKGDMEQALLSESNTRFRQASETPAMTTLFPHLGLYGISEAADQILAGTFQPPETLSHWEKQWLIELERPPYFKPMPVDRSVEDFARGWEKSKERTSSSPFGLGFTNYKSHTMNADLTRLDFQLASIPLRTGASPPHWHQGMNAWILKKPNEYRVSKMRTILLYDASFNQNNKWTGRAAMAHSEALQHDRLSDIRQPLAPEQYGSRKGHQAVDQCLNKRLTFDLSWILHKPMALCANDAKSCYDRVVHSVASLCLQRIGCPKPVVITMFETIQNLRHHVRSQYGDSELFYQAKQGTLPIQGLGQGNGAGPTIWALISTPVLNMLRTHGYGIKITSCISGDYLHFVGYSFVDDTDLVEFAEKVTTAHEVANAMQESIDAWEAGIRATGGAIVPEKSHWYLVTYRWQNGRWRYARKTEDRFDLTVLNEHGQRQILQRLDAMDSERTLGSRICPKGSMNKEKAYLRQCTTTWADQIRTGKLPRRLTWQALLSTIMRTLAYPLPITTFSRKECDWIMAPVLRVALSHSGVCNNLPRAIVYAPLKYQGLGIPDIYIEQGLMKLMRLIKFGRKSRHLTSSLIRHNCEAMKMEMGMNGYLFHHDPTIWDPIVTATWLKWTWKFAAQHRIHLRDDLPDFPIKREHDEILMQQFGTMGFRGQDLYKLNICRIHLKAITLSDITDGNGERITDAAWTGQLSSAMNTQYQWPIQPRPPETFWVIWRQATHGFCERNQVLKRKLGRWTSTGALTAVWWFCPRNESLFKRTEVETVTFTMRSTRNTRNSSLRFRAVPTTQSVIPPTAKPCTISVQGNDLLIQGFSDYNTLPVPRTVPITFPDYLASLVDKIWIFSSIQIRGSMIVVADAIRNGTCVCVTDGSYKEDHGTAAWKILDLANPDHSFAGQCVTPGTADQQNPYRSELSGLYASVSATNALIQFFEISSGTVTLACDNLGAIRTTSYNAEHTSPTGAQYDLVMAIQYAKSPNIQWNHTHVLGHQDAVADHTLSPLEQVNVEMDTNAKAYWEMTRHLSDHNRQHYFSEEPWSISIAGTKIVTDCTKTIQDWCQRPRIHAKWIEKRRIPEEELPHIDYTTTEQAMQSADPTLRRWVTKHTSGFCGVNMWMHRWKWRDSTQCPRCDEPVEDANHVWLCQGAESPERWTVALASLRVTMAISVTDPNLTNIIISRLTSWQTGTPPEMFPPLTPAYQTTVLHQDHQGWNNFFMGLPSNGWADLQQQYFHRTASLKSGRRWLTAIIRKQWSIAWDIWDYRNSVVHHKDFGTAAAVMKHALRAEYAKGVASTDMREFFKVSLQLLLQRSIQHQAEWLWRVQTARQAQQRRDMSTHRQRVMMDNRFMVAPPG
jgi:Reverse transcriptase (RNA-dependent DNA polymerase)